MTAQAYALVLAVVIAIVYLAVIRFMDVNEREPLWAVGLLFGLGALAAGILFLLIPSPLLELTILPAAVARGLAIYVAVAAGVAVLTAVSRWRGWSEISDLMDGIIYGTAGGLGFATGEAFIRELAARPAGIPGLRPEPAAVLGFIALTGLAYGLFGAIIGIGLAAGLQARSPAGRLGLPTAGLLGAILAYAGYAYLAWANALGGREAVVRTWVALVLPVLFVILIAAYSLSRERTVIREELTPEVPSGVVTDEELSLLQSFPRRQGLYLGTLLRGDFTAWVGLQTLHNLQVAFALAKCRASRETDPEHRAGPAAEVERIRRAALDARRALAGGLPAAEHASSSGTRGVGAG